MIGFIIFLLIVFMLVFKVYQKLTHMTFVSHEEVSDQVIIITGSNTGIGYATAKELSRRGGKVILACRNLEKARKAAAEIEKTTGNVVIAKYLDLACFDTIVAFAKDIIKKERRVHVLINNAGTGVLDNSLTKNLLPIEAQINYYGPFLLTMLLLPMMKSQDIECRIINVSSVMHKFGTVDNLDKQGKTLLERRRVYSNTKLATVLFTRKLAAEVRAHKITVNCLHPGAVATDMFRHQPRVIRYLLKFLFLTPEEGAQTSIYLAVARELNRVTGKYFSNCIERTPSKKALDEDAANRLWKQSLKICFGKYRW